MIVEPNSPVDYVQVCVLCEGGKLCTSDGRITPLEELEQKGSGFMDLCKTIDPNKGFIMAFVPNDQDRPVFFRAREIARNIGLHMQGTLEQPDTQRLQWDMYVKLRQLATVEDEPGNGEITNRDSS